MSACDEGCRLKCTQFDIAWRKLSKGVSALVLALITGSSSCFATAVESDTALVVQDIQCRGNVATACSFIRGHLYLTPGAQLDEREVEDAKLRLSALSNFKSVDIHLERGSEKGRVILVIEVAEADPLSLALVLGTSLRRNPDLQTVAARVGNHNLWGTGKTLDLLVVGDLELSHLSEKEYATRLEYFDPQLFGSSRYFLATGAFYSGATSNNSFGGGVHDNGDGGVDLSFGRRFGSFSYATVGYRYVFNSDANARYVNPALRNHFLAFDGNLTTLTDSYSRVVLLTYGRDSEDDAAFPTRGWMFHLYDNWAPVENQHFSGAEARVTFRWGSNSYVTLQTRPFNDFNAPFDDDLGTSITYARTISPSGLFEGLQRGRWYVGPGVTVINRHQVEIGIKAGIRAQTRHFGLVNLYVIGSHVTRTASDY
jgi:outer membrane protein assembly factor BamA